MAHQEGTPAQSYTTDQTEAELRFRSAARNPQAEIIGQAAEVRGLVDELFRTVDAGVFATMHKIYNETQKPAAS